MDYYDLTTQIHDLEYKFGQIVHAQLYEAEEKLKDLRPVLRHPHDLAHTFPDLAAKLLNEPYNIQPEPPRTKKTVHTNLKHFEALEDLISALDYLKAKIKKQKFPTVQDQQENMEYLFYVNRLIGAVQSSPPEIIEPHYSMAGKMSAEKKYGDQIDFVRSILNITEWEKNKFIYERELTNKLWEKFSLELEDSNTLKGWITKIANEQRAKQEALEEYSIYITDYIK